jgi:hypothetical protein
MSEVESDSRERERADAPEREREDDALWGRLKQSKGDQLLPCHRRKHAGGG